MESSIELDKSTALNGADLRTTALKILSKLFSHLAFEAPVARVVAELSFCFVLFEFLAQLSPVDMEKEHPGQWIALWFGCCLFVAMLDAYIFIPAFRIFNLAFHYAIIGKPEMAMSTFDLLNPISKRFVHLPTKVYHLERAKLLADLNQLELAQSELIKIDRKSVV